MVTVAGEAAIAGATVTAAKAGYDIYKDRRDQKKEKKEKKRQQHLENIVRFSEQEKELAQVTNPHRAQPIPPSNTTQSPAAMKSVSMPDFAGWQNYRKQSARLVDEHYQHGQTSLYDAEWSKPLSEAAPSSFPQGTALAEGQLDAWHQAQNADAEFKADTTYSFYDGSAEVNGGVANPRPLDFSLAHAYHDQWVAWVDENRRKREGENQPEQMVVHQEEEEQTQKGKLKLKSKIVAVMKGRQSSDT